MLLAGVGDEYTSELVTYTQFDLLCGSSVEDIADTFVNNILKNIFQYIHNNLESYHTILQLECTSQLELKINERIRNNTQRYISTNYSVGGAPEMYSYSHVSGATISITKYWVMGKQPISADKSARYVYNIISNSPLRIMARNHLYKSNPDSLA